MNDITNMYEDDAKTAEVDQTQLSVISEFARQQVRLQREVEKLEQQLKQATAELRRVSEQNLPDAMLAAGVRSFTLADGSSITIKEDISASLAEGKREAAVNWLKQNGYGDIVSEDVTLQFGKGKEELARAMVVELVDRGFQPVAKTNVNTATLKALIREMMAEGKEVPLETLGAWQWRKAVIK